MYEAIIGLEVHAQLKTASKLFCSCATSVCEKPNTHVCPICLGLPGVLPVFNGEALEFAVKAALATGCTMNPRNVFERKNYFYPDLPKAYQISQYEEPLAVNGYIDIGNERKIRIRRIHMEEDAGKLIHGSDTSTQSNTTFVDFNRASIPLVEIVSEPDITHPADAIAYLKGLKAILEYLEVCDCNMEAGNFRCDANISLRIHHEEKLGVKVEVKNLNSFKHIEKALLYEIKRQEEVLGSGGSILQETRLWNEEKGVTISMRSKEYAHDYRYFPDPDLPIIAISNEQVEKIKRSLPELKEAKKKKFISIYGLNEYDTDVLISDPAVADYFEQALTLYNEPKKLANWIQTEILHSLDRIEPQKLVEVITMIDRGILNAGSAKKVLAEIITTDKDPARIVDELGLAQIHDDQAVIKAVEEVIAQNKKEVEEYLAGKEKILGFLVGKIMKMGQGKFNPKSVNEILHKKIGR